MLINLSERSARQELMDDFNEGSQRLRRVFADINRVNAILGGSNITVKAVARLINENLQKRYTIIDMGCGDGHILRELAQYCRKKGIETNLIGVDLNAQALELAKEASLEYPEIRYHNRDILKLEAKKFECDIIINTLCMHHFPENELLVLIKKFHDLANMGIVVNDLQRSYLAYYLFKAFSLVFIRTKTAKVDGLISISKGFVKADLIKYAGHFPKSDHYIKWKWAFRYVWIIKPGRLTKI